MLTLAEVLALKLLSPLYTAVTVCAPTPRLEVVKLACIVPALELTVSVPSTVLPSINVTVPVGVPPPAPLTVAVNVTDSPGDAKLVEEIKEVELLLAVLWPTICVREALLPENELSPL